MLINSDALTQNLNKTLLLS